MNKMKEVAELLGVQLGEDFNVNASTTIGARKFRFTESGLKFFIDDNWVTATITLHDLLIGKYEIHKPILDKQEKEYLENVLRPFKDRVNHILKYNYQECESEFITVSIKKCPSLYFPKFEIGSMYKGMEADRKYTLEELGLFDNE